MTNVIDVANCIINDANKTATSLDYYKLEALAYYCQAYSLAILKEPIFQSKINISKNIIKIPELYKNSVHLYSTYTENNNGNYHLSENQKAVVLGVVKYYGQLNNKKLRNRIKQESPYLKAKHQNHKVISLDDMTRYYSILIK